MVFVKGKPVMQNIQVFLQPYPWCDGDPYRLLDVAWTVGDTPEILEH